MKISIGSLVEVAHFVDRGSMKQRLVWVPARVTRIPDPIAYDSGFEITVVYIESGNLERLPDDPAKWRLYERED